MKFFFIFACAFNAQAALTGLSCNSNVDYLYHSTYYKYHLSVSFLDKDHGFFSYSFIREGDGIAYDQGKAYFKYVALPDSDWINLTTYRSQKNCPSISKNKFGASLLTCNTENVNVKMSQLENAIRFVNNTGTMFICTQPP